MEVNDLTANNEQIWKGVLSEIELNTSKANFVTWFQKTSLLNKKDGVATVVVPNSFTKEWLENKYHKTILRLLRNISPEIKDVKYSIGLESSVSSIQKIRRQTAPASLPTDEQLGFKDFEVDKETNLNPKYTFENFIVGSFNELAHAAALSVVKNIGRTYNPLFIYSGVGLGKTHLVQSVGNEAVKIGKKVKYVTSEKFTSEVVNAITNNEMDQFKNKYRQTDVLIVDDIQFLSGKERTQEEFFHTFNSLYENNKQIILTSDRLPKAIPTLTERLRSRFEGGMIADISEPDQETRMAILRNKSREKEVEISEDIITFIAQNIQKNIRELEGALNRIIAFCRSKGVNPSLESAKSVLAALLAAPKKNITPKNIIQTVADFYDIQEKELIRKNRRQEVVKPRQIAMFLLREELKSSYPFIGQKLGGRDHTTAIHACEKISQEIKTNSSLQDEIKLILEKIYNKM